MGQPSNDSVIPGRGIVRTVGSELSVICTDMWLHIIWIWASCGGAQCPGAPCGRTRHMLQLMRGLPNIIEYMFNMHVTTMCKLNCL